MPQVLRIALPLPLSEPFDYLPPNGVGVHEVAVGARLVVPFGKRTLTGVVVGHGFSGGPKLRAAVAVFDPQPFADAALWDSLLFAAAYYQHPLGEVLAAAIPGAGATNAETEDRAAALDSFLMLQPGDASKLRPGSAPAQLLALLSQGPQSWQALRQQIPNAHAARRRLLHLGLAAEIALSDQARQGAVSGPPLNSEQQFAADTALSLLGQYVSLVVEGVTGSGKTEVYLAAISAVLARGGQVLVLVPEIGLTPQTLARFRERLPAPVLPWHSGLSDGARQRAWQRARGHEPLVVVGTRSAVFAPLPRLALIVIDEEHDLSFKQQDGFRYHARDFAQVRAKKASIPVLLGSATPSFETLANIERGRYRHVALLHRAGAARPPIIQVVDQRRERQQEGLGGQALAAIAETLGRGEQVLVFRNRRGFANVLHCTDCGWHAECPRCDHAFTVHRQRNKLVCHRCGLERPLPKLCPACSSEGLKPVGIGTERLERALQERFPQTPVWRIDRDAVSGVARLDSILEQVRHGQPCIVVGTQMIAKGHDLHGLTLVVIADADGGLYSIDPRAPERLAQLIVQVAGRAGRGARAGRVLIQTHHPEHALFARLLQDGYGGFARSELALRQQLRLPPFSAQALLRAEAKEASEIHALLQAVRQFCADLPGLFRVLGPMPAPQPRRAGFMRQQLLFESDERGSLSLVLNRVRVFLGEHKQARRLRWSLDVDPVSLD